jgi:hypothetical protein
MRPELFVRRPPPAGKLLLAAAFQFHPGADGSTMRPRDTFRAMATRVLISADEYLRTSFDGPDREFLDGEVVERNAGEKPS